MHVYSHICKTSAERPPVSDDGERNVTTDGGSAKGSTYPQDGEWDTAWKMSISEYIRVARKDNNEYLYRMLCEMFIQDGIVHEYDEDHEIKSNQIKSNQIKSKQLYIYIYIYIYI